MHSVVFRKTLNDIPIWSKEVGDTELIAGMLAAAAPIMDDLDNEYYLDTSADISYYRVINSVDENGIYRYTSFYPPEGIFFIWMRSSVAYEYSLYAFGSDKFFKGIISICNHFAVDFRNYIYGLPYDNNGNQYSIAGYELIPYSVVWTVPDLDDIEEQEKDDENIIEPLKKDY